MNRIIHDGPKTITFDDYEQMVTLIASINAKVNEEISAVKTNLTAKIPTNETMTEIQSKLQELETGLEAVTSTTDETSLASKVTALETASASHETSAAHESSVALSALKGIQIVASSAAIPTDATQTILTENESVGGALFLALDDLKVYKVTSDAGPTAVGQLQTVGGAE